jgi:hypothetical protein
MDIALFAPTCDAFALKEAGVAGFENVAQETGATFYAAVCFLYQNNFLEIAQAGYPPSPPPNPAPPMMSGRLIIPVRIFFAGGFNPLYLEATKTATGRVTGAAEPNEEVKAEEKSTVFEVTPSTDEETLNSYELPNRKTDEPYRGRMRKLNSVPGPSVPPVQLGEETTEREAEYVDVETSAMVIEHCSDDENTVCQTAASDQTWIKVRCTKINPALF